MRCKVCNIYLTNDRADCPVCGFSHIDNRGSSLYTEEMVNVYRHQKLAKVSIGVITYDYVIENENINLVTENHTIIANGNDLEYGRIVWCDKDYMNLPDGVVNICVFVKNGEFNERAYSMEIDTSTFKSYARIGVFLNDGLTIKFLVGTPDKRIMTDSISLV